MRQGKLTARQIRELLQRVPFDMLLGMRLEHVHDDGITVACEVRADLRNYSGAAHGGVAAALADAAVGLAIQRHCGGSRPITTVELKINYFLPVSAGRMFARARLLRTGSTLCVGSVELMDARAQRVGAAIVTYMFLDARGSGAAGSGAGTNRKPGKRR